MGARPGKLRKVRHTFSVEMMPEPLESEAPGNLSGVKQ
jgi:hypothetical protein